MHVAMGAAVTGGGVPIAGGCRRFAGSSGREHRQFFLQFLRAAFRARGPFPLGGSYQDLTIFSAFSAMKLVNRHVLTLVRDSGFIKELLLGFPNLPGFYLWLIHEMRKRLPERWD